MFNIGVSYGSAIKDPDNINELRQWSIEFMEIPLSKDAFRLKPLASSMGYEIALHIPSYELIDRYPFLMNTESINQISKYVDSITAMIESVGVCSYVVAHYPLISRLKGEEYLRLNEYYLARLDKLRKNASVQLFIENVAVHPEACLPECYCEAMNYCDGLCLDVGHAYTVYQTMFGKSPDIDFVDEFLRILRNDIRAVHLYNTTNNTASGNEFGLHYPFVQMNSNGFMDVEAVGKQILQLPHLHFVIHEPHRITLDQKSTFDFGPFGFLKGG